MANFLGRPLGGRRLWPKRIRDREPGVQRAPVAAPGGGAPERPLEGSHGATSLYWWLPILRDES